MPSEIPDVNHVHALDYAHRIALEVCQLIKVSDRQLDDPCYIEWSPHTFATSSLTTKPN